VIKAAITRAVITITITASRVVETGKPDVGVDVGGKGVLVKVGVEVGHEVMVGRVVGVNVGRVGVGV
jgi:hypothetical protein